MYPCGEVYMAYVSSGIPLIWGVKVLNIRCISVWLTPYFVLKGNFKVHVVASQSVTQIVTVKLQSVISPSNYIAIKGQSVLGKVGVVAWLRGGAVQICNNDI